MQAKTKAVHGKHKPAQSQKKCCGSWHATDISKNSSVQQHGKSTAPIFSTSSVTRPSGGGDARIAGVVAAAPTRWKTVVRGVFNSSCSRHTDLGGRDSVESSSTGEQCGQQTQGCAQTLGSLLFAGGLGAILRGASRVHHQPGSRALPIMEEVAQQVLRHASSGSRVAAHVRARTHGFSHWSGEEASR